MSLTGILRLPVYYIQIIAGLPFAILQFLIYSRRIEKTIIAKDPVFILGHYRSGTTYLQKLVISNKQFGFLTNYDALFPNSNLLFGKQMQHVFQILINWFRIKNPFFNNSTVSLSEPTEEDDYLMNKASVYSAYWGLVFPKRWREWLNGAPQFSDPEYADGWKREYLKTLKYVTFRNVGKQLVLKSPPNTERIGVLLQLFPHAKFIYIYRNPFHLFYSTKNMWKKAILSYYSVQKISDDELDEIVFEHFEYLMDQYEKDKHLIPEGNLIEISYEELKADPYNTILKIYSEINLPDFELTAKELLLQIESEKEYQNFQYQFDDASLEKIERRWGKYTHQWNYKTPKNAVDMKASPAVIWLTGLSGAGKTTIANCLIERFKELSVAPVLLDGDEIRKTLRVNNFDEDSRKKHNLYVGYFASLLEKQGNVVIVALISPYKEIRNEVRAMCTNFIEVYVSTKIEICIERDAKGHYKKALSGEIKDFTGISAPYFPPDNPEITIDNGSLTFSECTDVIFDYYKKKE
ncbi:MAG: adenylyl-sulfate kinase [Bacteroidota bacterium]|nr:adenylyl-sulfate kinase [Bacteroidota bacterium]